MSLSYALFPLHPDTPPEGVLLRDYFKGRFDIDKAHARMRGLMDAEGLAFAPPERMANTRLAQELGKWGEAKAPRIHDALYRANFVEGRALSQVETLVEVAREQGLDAAEAARVLADRAMKDAVDHDWNRARALGVTGVPTFVAEGRGVVGAQPYEVLEQLVLAAGAKRR